MIVKRIESFFVWGVALNKLTIIKMLDKSFKAFTTEHNQKICDREKKICEDIILDWSTFYKTFPHPRCVPKYVPAYKTILMPQASDQNQPTSRKVTVPSCAAPTNTLMQSVTTTGSPLLDSRDLPQHSAKNPLIIVPEWT